MKSIQIKIILYLFITFPMLIHAQDPAGAKRYGSSPAVTCVSFSSDGRFVVSGSVDGFVKLFDAGSGKELWSFVHGSSVKSVCFSPDGSRVISGGANGSVQLWDLSTRKSLWNVVRSPTVINDNVDTRSGEVIVRPQNGAVKDLSFGPSMVCVQGGTFSMGSNEGDSDEKPVHQVSVSDYWMSQTEVTVGDYLVFCEATNSHYPSWLESGNMYHIETGINKYYADKGYSRLSRDLPIVGVSWDDAVAYCAWLSKKTGLSYRLPTEAEWEFASRGGTLSKQYVYSGSNDPDVVGWHDTNAGSKPHVVKQKQGNELGLYDMSGNVWEWCHDWYGSYSSAAQQNPEGASSGVYRVLRGGCWLDTPQYSRVASRHYFTPDYRNLIIGFRVLFSQATGNVRLGGK